MEQLCGPFRGAGKGYENRECSLPAYSRSHHADWIIFFADSRQRGVGQSAHYEGVVDKECQFASNALLMIRLRGRLINHLELWFVLVS